MQQILISSGTRALLQYHITQDPRIAGQFGDAVELFRQTLESHRLALKIDAQNADILFNTAQVLRSLAEALDEEDEDRAEQVKLVQESVELLASCLAKQETEYSESQALLNAQPAGQADDEDVATQRATAADAKEDDEEEGSEGAGDWATVVEPTTPSTLLETALAQLDALTMLVGLSSPADKSTLSTISGIANTLIQDKIPAYIALIPSTAPEPPPISEGASLSISATSTTFNAGASSATPSQTSPQQEAQKEARLCIANWQAGLADTEYRSLAISIEDYAMRVNNAFAFALDPSAPIPRTVDDLSAFADALIEFDAAVSEDSARETPAVQKIRWTALSTAQDLLKEASETMGARKPSIYLARGDVEFKRSRLSSRDASSSNVDERVKLLLANAGVYYRGASALANQARQAGKESEDEWAEAEVKGQIVIFAGALLMGEAPWGLSELKKKGIDGEKVKSILEEIVEDGLIDGQTAEGYLAAVEGTT